MTISFFLVLKLVNFSELIANYAVNDFNKKIYGAISFKDARLGLNPKNLDLYFEIFILKDQNSVEIFKAKNLRVKWSLKNLFDPNQRINELSADNLFIAASKNKNGKWNFENLFKKPAVTKLKYSFREINVPQFTLHISDDIGGSQLKYENVKVFFKTIKHKKLYSIDVETTSNGDNLISVKGNLNLAGDQNFLLNRNNLNVHLVDFQAINLQFFSSIFDFGAYNKNFTAAAKYLEGSRLTLDAQVNSNRKSKNNFKFNLQVNELRSFDHVTADFIGNLTADLLTVSKMDLNAGEALISCVGTVSKWQEKDPILNLNFRIHNLSLQKLKVEINKLKIPLAGFIYETLAVVLKTDLVNGNFKIASHLTNPDYSLNLDMAGSNNQLKTNFQYHNAVLVIKSLDLPFEASKLSLRGSHDLKNNNFDFEIVAKAAPLQILTDIVSSLPIAAKLQVFLIKSKFESGTTDFNMHINSVIDPQTKLKRVQINSSTKIRNVNLNYEDYPIEFKNLNSDMEVKDYDLNIKTLTGYLGDDYVELRGSLDYRNLSEVNLELASPEFNASNFNDLKLLENLKKSYGINMVSGVLKDFYLAFKRKDKNIDIVSHANIDMGEVVFNDSSKVSKIRGLFALKDKVLKFTKFTFSFGDDSIVLLDGLVDETLKAPNLILQAKKLSLAKISKIFGFDKKLKINFTDGTLNSNLTLKDKDYFGTIDFNSVGFNYLDSKYGVYPVSNMKGKINFNKYLYAEDLSGKYGASVFKNLNIHIDKPKSADRIFSLSFNGDLYANELSNFMPQGIKSLLTVTGYLPARILISGNRQKQKYNIEADLDNVDSFSFSNWLVYQKNVPVQLKAKFTVTPQQIISEDCKIIFSNGPSKINKMTRIKSTFQIEDWSNSRMTYYTVFSISNKIGNADLAYVAPQIISLKPMNLSVGRGYFDCDTSGDIVSRQTICDIRINSAVAKKYGIGDLKANKITVGLLSINNKPLDADISSSDGDWNGIPYKNLDLDLKANGDFVYIDNLTAVVKDGTLAAKTSFNVKTLESTFRMKGDKLPAHELVQGIWLLGDEVPAGVVSGTFEGKTVGILPDPMFYNLEGSANLSVKNGQLSQLKSMQRILTAVNTMTNFDVNNVFQVLITYKGGLFNDLISAMKYDKGVISSEKVLLKADAIELDLSGFLDFNKDHLSVKGKGMIPRRAKSILQTVGVGKANLGNILSKANLDFLIPTSSNRFFEFQMTGPISDMETTAESVRSTFKWTQ